MKEGFSAVACAGIGALAVKYRDAAMKVTGSR
jgi:hypothetical protein